MSESVQLVPDLRIHLLDTAQVAEVLRVKPATVAEWRRQKRGPDFAIIGGRRLYTREAVLEWLSRRMHMGEQ